MTLRSWKNWGLPCGVAMLLFSGCDLFRTRDPEVPAGPRGTFVVPRIPQDVIDNLQAALTERITENYMYAFDETTFEFIADQDALIRDPGLTPWGYGEEYNHITHLFSPNTLPDPSGLVPILRTEEENILPDSASLRVAYVLNIDESLSGPTGMFEGTARFDMRVGHSGYYQIYRWTDLRTGSIATWSDLKSLVR